MNISLENKTIWLCPERTGGRVLKDIFEKNSIFNCDERNEFELLPLSEKGVSHDNIIPEKYSDFTIITSIRNPYDRVWSLYLNFYTKNFQPKEFEKTKKKFNEYIQNSITKTISGFKIDSFYGEKNHFNKWKFTDFIPNKVIRLEHIENDLKSLDFIKNLYNLDSTHINHRPLTFDLMYEWKSAQIIYQFYKNHFLFFGYDPFSFTKEELSEEEKIKFIHDL